MINLQFLFPSMKILVIFPSSAEANDTYTCIPFKLTSYLGDKNVI